MHVRQAGAGEIDRSEPEIRNDAGGQGVRRAWQEDSSLGPQYLAKRSDVVGNHGTNSFRSRIRRNARIDNRHSQSRARLFPDASSGSSFSLPLCGNSNIVGRGEEVNSPALDSTLLVLPVFNTSKT
jgi:hypothetical protein